MMPVAPLEPFGALFTHRDRSGADLVHLRRAGTDHTFGIAFPTPPDSDTGLPHVVEHLVLCGSHRFPRLSTGTDIRSAYWIDYQNAFTTEAYTCYLFSTRSPSDFLALLDVHLDAVFHPLLHPDAFEREVTGTSRSGRGVIVNEMRGRVGTPAFEVERAVRRALFPGTYLARNSGGDPGSIAGLTLDDARRFWSRFYTPANAFVFGSGPTDPEAFAAEVAKRLPSGNGGRAGLSTHGIAPLPTYSHACLPAFREAGEQLVVAWKGPPCADVTRSFQFRFLSEVLVGAYDSPLAATVLAARLGRDLADITGYRELGDSTAFAIGIKGGKTAELPEEEFTGLVLDGLSRLAREGVPESDLTRALSLFEMQLLDTDTDGLPLGGRLFFHLLPPWQAGAHPRAALDLRALMTELRRRLTRRGWIESLIERELLGNDHRSTVRLDPRFAAATEPSHGDKPARPLRPTADPAAASHPDLAEMTGLDHHTQRDRWRQMPPVRAPRFEVATSDGIEVGALRVDDTGLIKISGQVDLSGVDAELLPFVGFFSYLANSSRPSADTAALIREHTGGISLSPVVACGPSDPDGISLALAVNGRAPASHGRLLPGLMRALLEQSARAEPLGEAGAESLVELLARYNLQFEASVGPKGHVHALRLASTAHRLAARAREHLTGFEHHRRLSGISAAAAPDRTRFSEILTNLSEQLARAPVRLFVSGPSSALPEVVPAALAAFGGRAHPAGNPARDLPSAAGEFPPPVERYVEITSPVAYNALVFPTVPFAHEDSPAVAVLASLLLAERVWREIREVGGAYGAFCDADPQLGVLRMASFRDPTVRSTLAAFTAIAEGFRAAAIGDAQLDRAKLATYKANAPRMSAHSFSAMRFFQYALGFQDGHFDQFHRGIASVERSDLERVAERYLRPAEAAFATLANRQLLAELRGGETM